MQFVPWQYIADWKCIACGYCCKLYSVVLNFNEWLKIVKNYGVEQTVSGLDKFLIKRRDDGSCSFLCQFSNTHICGIQNMKPKACKLWGLLKFSPNPSLETSTKRHTITVEAHSLFMQILCVAVLDTEVHHGNLPTTR